MRRGIVLLEVLVAAAILASAALALMALQERCLAQAAASERVAVVARVAQRLLEEVELQEEITPGTDGGRIEQIPGATYSRAVELRDEQSGTQLLRVRVSVEYPARRGVAELNLEKWVFRSRAAKGPK